MIGPRDLPDVRDRRPPLDPDDDGVAGYLPELRDESAFDHDTDEDENEDEDEDEDEAGL